jgi:hypothetical protein
MVTYRIGDRVVTEQRFKEYVYGKDSPQAAIAREKEVVISKSDSSSSSKSFAERVAEEKALDAARDAALGDTGGRRPGYVSPGLDSPEAVKFRAGELVEAERERARVESMLQSAPVEESVDEVKSSSVGVDKNFFVPVRADVSSELNPTRAGLVGFESRERGVSVLVRGSPYISPSVSADRSEVSDALLGAAKGDVQLAFFSGKKDFFSQNLATGDAFSDKVGLAGSTAAVNVIETGKVLGLLAANPAKFVVDVGSSVVGVVKTVGSGNVFPEVGERLRSEEGAESFANVAPDGVLGVGVSRGFRGLARASKSAVFRLSPDFVPLTDDVFSESKVLSFNIC